MLSNGKLEIHRTMKVDTYFYLTNHNAECCKFKMLAIRLNLVLTQKSLRYSVFTFIMFKNNFKNNSYFKF